MKRYPAVLKVIVDKTSRAKLKTIIFRLEEKGKTYDYCVIDDKGKPREISYLEMVRYGVAGPTLDKVKELIEATK